MSAGLLNDNHTCGSGNIIQSAMAVSRLTGQCAPDDLRFCLSWKLAVVIIISIPRELCKYLVLGTYTFNGK